MTRFRLLGVNDYGSKTGGWTLSALRDFALICCVLSALGGLVRTFWPQGSFRPVINTVLTLYIVTSAAGAVRGVDWRSFRTAFSGLTAQSAAVPDYSAYGEELTLEQSADALQTLLRQSGIESVVQAADGGIRVRLAYPADREQAEQLLQTYAGGLTYTLEAVP